MYGEYEKFNDGNDEADFHNDSYQSYPEYKKRNSSEKSNSQIDKWNNALKKSTTKTCKFCGETGLTWGKKHFESTGIWRLFKGNKIHECAKVIKAPKELTEEEILAAEKEGKRVYKMKNRKPLK